MSKKTPRSDLPSLPDTEISDLALGILKNEIFTDRHIAPDDRHLFASIFMVFAFMDNKERLRLARKSRPGLFYAPMNEAGPRAINGYPMFFSAKMLNEADTDKVWDEYRRLTASIQPGSIPT